MKKLFVCFIIPLLAIVGLFGFSFVPTSFLSAFTYDNTYTYNASISTEYDTTFLNGITSVESVSFDYKRYCRYDYNGGVPVSITLSSYGSLKSSYNQNYDFIQIALRRNKQVTRHYDVFDYNISIFGDFNLKSYSNGNNFYDYVFTGKMTSFLFTDFYLQSTSNNPLPYVNAGSGVESSQSYYSNDSDLDSYLDFDSSTNYTYVFDDLDIDYSTVSYSLPILEFLENVTVKGSNSGFYSGFYPSDYDIYVAFRRTGSSTWESTDFNAYNYFNYNIRCEYYSGVDNYTLKSYNIVDKLFIENFECIINRPVSRLETTLVLYNYDYDCAISHISSIEYALSKDNNLYKAKYNGGLPNSSYIGVTCESLQNRLYDKYIYLYLTFNNNGVDCQAGSFSLGFDFNFSKYYEPYVIESNVLTRYSSPDLNKPEHWYDFGGWIRYAFVWCIFYNPVTGKAAQFIYSIFSLIVSVFKFILGFEFGAFVTGYIGFIILINLMAYFIPFKSLIRSSGYSSENEYYNKISKNRSQYYLDKYDLEDKNLKAKQKELDKKHKKFKNKD